MESAAESKDPIQLEALVTPKIEAYLGNSPAGTRFKVFPGNLAEAINKHGLREAQRKIDAFCQQIGGSQAPVFICQHILGEQLSLHDGQVYSPHATVKNRFNLIPHFNAIASDFVDYMPIKSRRWLGTFIGATSTNPVRQKIVGLLSNDDQWLIRDTGTWHFNKSQDNQAAHQAYYKASLATSVSALCPPGTGAGTLRLWESMSFGCIPVIFGESLIPKEMDDLVIRIHHLDSKLSIEEAVFLPPNELSRRSAYIYNLYWSKFANQRIADLIISDLEQKSKFN